MLIKKGTITAQKIDYTFILFLLPFIQTDQDKIERNCCRTRGSRYSHSLNSTLCPAGMHVILPCQGTERTKMSTLPCETLVGERLYRSLPIAYISYGQAETMINLKANGGEQLVWCSELTCYE